MDKFGGYEVARSRAVTAKRRAAPLAAAVLVCGLHLALSGRALAQSDSDYRRGDVPRAEVLQLPRFCWARYIKELQSAEYRIPRSSCGAWTNHYCDALLGFSRVRRGAVSAKKRRTELRLARESVTYTLRGTEAYPACPIRPHVESTLLQIDALLGQIPNVKR